MSIRLRLTLLYSTIVAFTIITFGSILYITQSREAFDSIRSDLMRQATRLANASEHRPGLPEAWLDRIVPPYSGLLDEESAIRILPGRWTQTLSADGVVTGQSLDLSGTSLPLSKEGLACEDENASGRHSSK